MQSKFVCQTFQTGGAWKLKNEIKKCHFNRGHGYSLADQAQQSKKPSRVPLEMFLHSQGRPPPFNRTPACPSSHHTNDPTPHNKVTAVECCHLRLEMSKVADISLWRPPNLSQLADCACCVLHSNDWAQTAHGTTTQWVIKKRGEINRRSGSLNLFPRLLWWNWKITIFLLRCDAKKSFTPVAAEKPSTC